MLRTFAMLCLLVGCGAPTDLEPVRDPSPAAAGFPGTMGPFGVARARWRAPVRVTERLTVEVSVPLDAGGDVLAGARDVVVFIPGGLVAPDRYRWLATHLASRGYVAVVPHPPANLALFGVDDARAALDAVRRAAAADGPLAALEPSLCADDEPCAAVLGHSLGGVTAAQAWRASPRDFTALGMIAAFPAGDVPAGRQGDDPVLSITGSTDQRADADRIRDGLLAFEPPRLLAVVDGLNHYDWADDVTQAELDRDGPRERPVAQARGDAMRVIDTWLDFALRDVTLARIQFEGGSFSGVEVER